jgi:hypothetical protein
MVSNESPGCSTRVLLDGTLPEAKDLERFGGPHSLRTLRLEMKPESSRPSHQDVRLDKAKD